MWVGDRQVDVQNREQLIREHLSEIRRLEMGSDSSLRSARASSAWPPDGYYLLWHVVVGMMLGLIGSLVSLLANVLGAPLFGKSGLELIRVYLTFPMGERALHAEDGVILFIGCVLYLCTGSVYGIVFHVVMSSFFSGTSTITRFFVATAIGLGLWIVNFYLILSWLQPMLLGDNWIVRLVPVWVAVLTHLAFAWTMLAIEFWGHFEVPQRHGATVT